MFIISILLFLSIQWATLQPAYTNPYLIVLGIAQDGGYPQAGCEKECCQRARLDPSKKRFVTSLALVDPKNKKWWLFEATPDIRDQLQLFQDITGHQFNELPDGVFITHGHIGHYTGLMDFGREVMNTQSIPVYAMPRMKNFLINNGPWSQLVQLQNISIMDMHADSAVTLPDNIQVLPFLVPHRDEYTETVGFRISCNQFSAVFIPDIDKWNKFNRSINDIVHNSDLAFLDGTFYQDGELPDRSMKDIPHPFITESMQQFSTLPDGDKKKIHFIHFNHTNPLLNEESAEFKSVIASGYNIARQGESIELK